MKKQSFIKTLILFFIAILLSCSRNSKSIGSYNIRIKIDSLKTNEDAVFYGMKKYSMIVSLRSNENMIDTISFFPDGEFSYVRLKSYIFVKDPTHWVVVGKYKATGHFLSIEHIRSIDLFQQKYGQEGNYFFLDTLHHSKQANSSFHEAYMIDRPETGYRLYYKKNPNAIFRTIARNEIFFSDMEIKRHSIINKKVASKIFSQGKVRWMRDYDYNYIIIDKNNKSDTIICYSYNFETQQHIYIVNGAILVESGEVDKRHWGGKSLFKTVSQNTMESYGIEDGRPIPEFWHSQSDNNRDTVTIINFESHFPRPKIETITLPDSYERISSFRLKSR
ncbi:MAG: hypothetical protein IK045_03450 [Bacteroidales bacterium]|nr:hypothetical protein [Bacteroidales bacterium]